ncbi:MFS transporter [Streptomyces sp. MST-110588]|uniref:MFS transporter n=1 Tax=Streptomyces sp. MST-110588 TaxID=2833628 RepID=UPI001F5D69D9|nr:MFS transporter [Streptomyces sp. MST-110588]UNO41787.1 MFS transporter [Streptomyces sp. MST-110588]
MVTQAAPPPVDIRHPDLRQWLALVVVLAGTCLVELDLSIVNVALQPIRSHFGAGVSELELIISGYTLAFGLTLVTGGRLGDIHGYRRMFIIGVAAFSAASLACALAWEPIPLIGFRVLQGVAAGLMLPQTLSIIQLEFSGRHRARAFGLFGAVTGIAAIIGQIVGGLLIGLDIAGLSWRAIFLINLPIGLAAVIGALLLLPENRKKDRPSLDLPGVGLLTVALLCVIAPLVFGGGEHGHPLLLLLVLAAIPAMAVFLRRENRAKRHHHLPLIDPELLRRRTFRAGVGLSLTFVAGNIGLFFLISLYFQGPLGFSPLKAGLLFTPLALCFGIASLVAPKIGPKAGHHVLTIGYVINIAGTAALLGSAAVYGRQMPEIAIVIPLAVIGFGEGLGFTPLINIVLAGVPERDAGSASGALETGIQIGSALGPALLGTVYSATSAFTWGLGVNLLLATSALAFLPMMRSGHHTSTDEKDGDRTPATPVSAG